MLVSVSIDEVTASILDIGWANELEELPILRKEPVDVREFIVVSALIDDNELAGMKIDVR